MGKVLLVACTNVGRYIIEEILNNKDIKSELAGVVNLNQQQANNKANYDSYADIAVKYGFPIHYCNNINDPETVDWIKSLAPDIIIQSGWSQKFKDELLEIPKYACIGEHPAPLPKGRGAACVNWAVLTGETEWGDTFFQMVSEYDKGAIYAQEFFKIEEYDTVYTVYEKVAMCAKNAVRKNIDNWTSGKFDIAEQDDSKATHYPRRRPTDGEIKSFDQPAKTIHDFIRAQTFPYPGAYVTTGGRKLIFISSEICRGAEKSGEAGTILGTTDRGGILVSCADNIIEIPRVKEDASPSVWAKDWAEQNNMTGKKFF
ncbi:MAG: methionyl-tRNA formyltransferase [Acutalibacteraceae bacterium]